MELAVFGATAPTGRRLVQRALAEDTETRNSVGGFRVMPSSNEDFASLTAREHTPLREFVKYDPRSERSDAPHDFTNS